MAVGVRLYGQKDLGVGRNLATDKLNIVTKGVEVDFNPIGARDSIKIGRIL